MASGGVSVLKFVGTVSLGLLTGLSYSLSTLALPALLELPSATGGRQALNSLASSSKAALNTLASISGSAFILAFALSPRAYRHPYLIYSSLLVLGSHLATANFAAPYLFPPEPASSSTTRPASGVSQNNQKMDRHGRSRMEMSFEVVGAGTSDAHSDEGNGSASGEDVEVGEELVNGEEVRMQVEGLRRKQLVQAAVSGLGFLLSVVGIWGDGASQALSETVFIQV